MIALPVLLQTLALLVLPAIAIVLIVIAIAGRRDLTRPLCGGCRAPLTFAHFDSDAACDRCGVAPSARTPCCARRRPWIAPLLVGFTLIGLSVAFVITSVMLVRGVAMPMNTNAQLLARHLAMRFGRMASGPEIRTRIDDGSMTLAEVKAVLLPAVDPKRGTPAPSENLRDLAALVLSREPDPALAKLVLENGFGPPVLWNAVLATTHPMLQSDPTTMGSSDEPLVRVVVLRSFQLNGEEQPLSSVIDARLAAPLLPLAMKRLPSGNQSLLLGVETFLYDRFDAERLRGPDGSALPESDWPEPLARSTTSLGIQLTVP